jgi:hypothetical protein
VLARPATFVDIALTTTAPFPGLPGVRAVTWRRPSMLVLASAVEVAAITAGGTLVAALGLAVVTLHIANKRSSDETNRQLRNLDAEAERQRAALTHARELADLADLRSLLDEAALALDRAYSANAVDLRITPHPIQLEVKLNGAGNLIVGYDEEPGSQTGSHDVVLGIKQTFTSYGGLLAGERNTISAPNASVTAGIANTASGSWSAVSGGALNIASASAASISGGGDNKATFLEASVSGGEGNVATGEDAAVSGGRFNSAQGRYSSIFGGQRLTATNEFEAIP